MKTIVLLFIVALISVFGLIVAKEHVRPYDVAATVQVKETKNCGRNAIVKAYRSLNTGEICTYLLQVNNGDFIYPQDLPAGFQLQEGMRVTVNYKKIGEIGFILDCVVTDAPVFGASIKCISADANSN